MNKPENKKKGIEHQTLLEQAKILIESFKKHDPKPWSLEAKALDLVSHTGLIAQMLLERKGYKAKTKDVKALDKELAIVFFIILDIAEESGIDFEKAFLLFIGETKKNLT